MTSLDGSVIGVHILELPLELLAEIFSYLGTRRNLVNCCKVCKVFYAAANSPFLWKALCEKVWRIYQCNIGDEWKTCYEQMYCNWTRYEHCYADIKGAWDRIEMYCKTCCPSLIQGLTPGATEEELNNAEMHNLNGLHLPDDYRCFLRIHNGQRHFEQPSILGATDIANHHKREALLNVQIAASGLNKNRAGLQGCIPISLCVTTTTGHYMAISEEAGHPQGRVFWPSADNTSLYSSRGGRLHCFVMAESFRQWFITYSMNMIKEEYPVIRNEIYPYKFGSSYTGDNGITVRTATMFLPELSRVNPPQFFFTYRISISMDPTFSKSDGCKLETRHWYITNGNDQKEEVYGDAVVGNYPVMYPGAKFEYVSCTNFTTPTGTMEGHYVFKYLHKPGTTNARIAPMYFKAPPFELASDRIKRRSSQLCASESDQSD